MAKHPCVYPKQFLPLFANILNKRKSKTVLDIFGGVGTLAKVKEHGYKGKVWINEIEPKWAEQAKAVADKVIVGDARKLALPNGKVDAIVTSPTYGNDMGVTYLSRERTYRVCLGEDLKKGNTGGTIWGDTYREIHSMAYAEAIRVLKPNGILVLNVKNHIRNGKEQKVAQWHKAELESKGFKWVSTRKVKCSGINAGGLNIPRLPYEYVMTFEKRGM